MNPRPVNLSALKAMAQRCIEHGAFEEALAYYGQIVQAEPGDAQAHYARGTILRRLHRPKLALTALRSAADLSNEAPPQLELADFLLTSGRLTEAIQYCQRALATAPGAFEPSLLMARALGESGSAELAEPFWEAAERLEPAPGQAALARAMYLANKGHFAEASKSAMRAIELSPTSGRSYYALFASRRVTEADRPIVEQVESVLKRSDIKPPDRIDLLYALGKAYDNLVDYERAMVVFDEANELQKRLAFGGRPFDPKMIRQMVDRQIELLDRPAKRDEVKGPVPVFVVGMPRSGTTLVDQILSSHSQVGSVGEQAFWLDYQNYPLNQRLQLRTMYSDLLSFLQPGFPFVVDKNPTNLFVIGLIRAAVPDAKIIGITRDPVDTAISMWTTQMQTTAPFMFDRANIVSASRECARLMKHCRQSVSHEQYMEVRYEDLAQNPETGTRTMLDFIGLEWDDRCAHPEQNARSVSTPSFWQVRQPVYQSSINRRQNYEPYLGVFNQLAES